MPFMRPFESESSLLKAEKIRLFPQILHWRLLPEGVSWQFDRSHRRRLGGVPITAEKNFVILGNSA
jgi:hypothetical protein